MFLAMVARKVPAQMDLTPVLLYATRCLKNNQGDATDLSKELILRTAGIEALRTPTSVQLRAFSGGKLLRDEVVHPAAKSCRRHAERFLRALIETGRLRSFCVLLGQKRQEIMFSGKALHVMCALLDNVRVRTRLFVSCRL